MNAEQYEVAAAQFAEVNREYNRAVRTGTLTDELELRFLRAEREHKAAYAAHAAASPDTSLERVLEDGRRVALSAEEIAARDRAQAVAEVNYWPAMAGTAEDLRAQLDPAELQRQAEALGGPSRE